MSPIDYQIQTTVSDGKYTPAQCVAMAKDKGVRSIAITDHDTVDGIPEALAAAEAEGVEVIPGVELSCEHRGFGIHMLGLGTDPESAVLLTLFAEARRLREERTRSAIQKLAEYGLLADFNNVAARATGVITSPHLAQEIMENPANAARLKAEGIHVWKDLYPIYLSEQARNPVYPKTMRLSAKDAIEAIHNARGIAVWSHPTIPMGDYKLVEDSLLELIGFGMEGIESIGTFSEDDTEFLNMLAAKYGLVRTAGSDFHDTYVDPAKPEEGASEIGGLKTYGYSLEGIRESVLAAIKKRSVAAGPAV